MKHVMTMQPWSQAMVHTQVRKKKSWLLDVLQIFRCLKRWLIWNCCSKAYKNCIFQISYFKVWWTQILLSSYIWIFKVYGSTVNFYAATENETFFFPKKTLELRSLTFMCLQGLLRKIQEVSWDLQEQEESHPAVASEHSEHWNYESRATES